jgi:hypothetical protein
MPECMNCKNNTDWICEHCQGFVCEGCSVKYTQQNLVDYVLCPTCYIKGQDQRAEEIYGKPKIIKKKKMSRFDLIDWD